MGATRPTLRRAEAKQLELGHHPLHHPKLRPSTNLPLPPTWGTTSAGHADTMAPTMGRYASHPRRPPRRTYPTGSYSISMASHPSLDDWGIRNLLGGVLFSPQHSPADKPVWSAYGPAPSSAVQLATAAGEPTTSCDRATAARHTHPAAPPSTSPPAATPATASTMAATRATRPTTQPYQQQGGMLPPAQTCAATTRAYHGIHHVRYPRAYDPDTDPWHPNESPRETTAPQAAGARGTDGNFATTPPWAMTNEVATELLLQSSTVQYSLHQQNQNQASTAQPHASNNSATSPPSAWDVEHEEDAADQTPTPAEAELPPSEPQSAWDTTPPTPFSGDPSHDQENPTADATAASTQEPIATTPAAASQEAATAPPLRPPPWEQPGWGGHPPRRGTTFIRRTEANAGHGSQRVQNKAGKYTYKQHNKWGNPQQRPPPPPPNRKMAQDGGSCSVPDHPLPPPEPPPPTNRRGTRAPTPPISNQRSQWGTRPTTKPRPDSLDYSTYTYSHVTTSNNPHPRTATAMALSTPLQQAPTNPPGEPAQHNTQPSPGRLHIHQRRRQRRTSVRTAQTTTSWRPSVQRNEPTKQNGQRDRTDASAWKTGTYHHMYPCLSTPMRT